MRRYLNGLSAQRSMEDDQSQEDQRRPDGEGAGEDARKPEDQTRQPEGGENKDGQNEDGARSGESGDGGGDAGARGDGDSGSDDRRQAEDGGRARTGDADDDSARIPDPDDLNAMAGEPSLEEDLVSLAETAAHIDRAETAAVVMNGDLDTVETVGAALDQAAQQEVQSEAVADLADAVVGRVQENWELGPEIAPALEAFKELGGKSRYDVSMEGVVETAQRLWEAVVRAFKAAYQWVADFFTKIFNSAEKLRKRLEATKKELDLVNLNTKPSADSFDNASVFNSLQVAGKTTGFEANLQQFKTTTQNVYDHSNAWCYSYGKYLLEALGGVRAVGVAGVSILLKPIPVPSGEFAGATKIADPKAAGFGPLSGADLKADNLQLMRTPEIFGGKAIMIHEIPTMTAGDYTAALIQHADWVGAALSTFDPKAAPAQGKTNATLAAAEIDKVLAVVDGALKRLETFKREEGNLRELKKRIAASLPRIFDWKFKPASADEAKKQLGYTSSADVRKIVRNASRMIDQPATAYSAYLLRTVKSLLDYVDNSASLYPKKSALKPGQSATPLLAGA